MGEKCSQAREAFISESNIHQTLSGKGKTKMVAENTNDSAFIGGNSKQYHKDTGRAPECRQTSALCRAPLKSVGRCVCVQE